LTSPVWVLVADEGDANEEEIVGVLLEVERGMLVDRVDAATTGSVGPAAVTAAGRGEMTVVGVLLVDRGTAAVAVGPDIVTACSEEAVAEETEGSTDAVELLPLLPIGAEESEFVEAGAASERFLLADC
jgi:hypothetical protein